MNSVLQLQALQEIPFDYIMWGVLGFVLIVFGVYSSVLLWHWKQYSTGKFTTVSNIILYLSVSTVFIFLMIGSAAAYSIL